jgi:hypothetical protein
VDLPGKVPPYSANGLPIASPLTAAACRQCASRPKRHCTKHPDGALFQIHFCSRNFSAAPRTTALRLHLTEAYPRRK